jgi:ABC-type molybdate transport system substrate-binding protein
MTMGGAMRALAYAAFVLTMTSSMACAEDLVVYGAGSLREAIGQIASEFGHDHGLTVKTQFGPSGRMRERIEQGEHVDLFTSADVGHARKLVEDGRASVMALFVRNPRYRTALAVSSAAHQQAPARWLSSIRLPPANHRERHRLQFRQQQQHRRASCGCERS